MATVSPNWEAAVEQVMLEAFKGYALYDDDVLVSLINRLSIDQGNLLKAACDMVYDRLCEVLK